MNEGQEQKPGMSEEQAADFAALSAAANDGAAVDAVGAQEAEPVRIELDKEIAGLLQMAAAIVTPVFPSIAKVYTAETCGAVGAAIAPVCHKRGWMQGGIGGKWGEEIMALAVIAPVAWSTREAILSDLEAKRPQQGPESGAGSVIVGQPIPEQLPDSGKSVTVGTVVQ